MNKKINVVKKCNIFQSKRSVILMAIPMIAILIFVSLASAESPPQIFDVNGTVFMSDGITKAPKGTNFSVNDTTSGFYIQGTTGGGPPANDARYSTTISGLVGDTVIIKAWNNTHYGETTFILTGAMTGIDVTLNTLTQTSIASIVISGSQTTTLTVGDNHLFTATVRDQNNNLMDGIELTWTVSNPSVGNVTPTNTITVTGSATSTFNAKAAGTTMVNATNGLFSDTVFVIVNAGNQAPVANPNGPYTGTEGIAVSFDGSASSDSDGTVNSYSWNFGDGTPTGTGATPSHTYAQNGTYTVNLTVTDNDGTPSPAVATTATISDTNPVSAFSGTPLIGPEPLTVTFTDASTSYDGLVSRTWDFGDGNTGTETNPTHDYTSNGTYTVSLTVCEDDGDCDTDTKADYITVGTTGIKGDVDGDGEVTAADALLYLRYAVGQNISPDVISTADDVTCDGAILADDALKVLRKAVGQDVNLVCNPV